ncbi:unnamed protein product [Didymodactylos carnosus]|uniref:Uncharacterized protein n=1 Tax=Didymodactylos carnosus TaxID=1234261 RepID=A0A815NTL5_9BILA|nr:unnamed protein product [Didymodactylos carnosus]CAF1442140.1 unnamed protein product [Didymodactylos carnosus]CAF4092567.1 unnamed protein product [Didymodactylos carnosus]CAF4317840.1 unnamed protein product [Didymodactylos carnosus]
MDSLLTVQKFTFSKRVAIPLGDPAQKNDRHENKLKRKPTKICIQQPKVLNTRITVKDNVIVNEQSTSEIIEGKTSTSTEAEIQNLLQTKPELKDYKALKCSAGHELKLRKPNERRCKQGTCLYPSAEYYCNICWNVYTNDSWHCDCSEHGCDVCSKCIMAELKELDKNLVLKNEL